MGPSSGERSAQFPLIERRYGQPVSFWLERLAELDDARYPAQMAMLQEEYGLSRSHANTLVMYARGSTTTRRFADLEAYLATLTPIQARTARAILDAVHERVADLETVIAWNKPMLRRGSDYVFGVAAAGDHLLLAPWGEGILDRLAGRLQGYEVLAKTVRVPPDWDVDADLLEAMVRERLRQLDARP